MFISNPTYELPFPPGLAGPGEKHFRAMDIGTRFPWFLVTFELTDNDTKVHHSVCCCWDTDLVALIAGSMQSAVVAIDYLTPAVSAGWSICSVKRVWRARDSQEQLEGVTFETEDGRLHRGSFGNEASSPPQDSTLVVDLK